MNAQTSPALLFDLNGTLIDSVYQGPADLLVRLDEVGIRAMD